MRKLIIVSSFALLTTACTSIQVSPLSKVELLNVQQVCIINNPKVIIDDFIPVVQRRLQHHNIQSRVINQANEQDCHYTLQYSAKRSWDFTPYLSWAELTLQHGNTIVAKAEYNLKGKGGLSLNKWQSVETKMIPVVDQLLGK